MKRNGLVMSCKLHRNGQKDSEFVPYTKITGAQLKITTTKVLLQFDTSLAKSFFFFSNETF